MRPDVSRTVSTATLMRRRRSLRSWTASVGIERVGTGLYDSVGYERRRAERGNHGATWWERRLCLFCPEHNTRQLRFPKRYGFRLFIHPSIHPSRFVIRCTICTMPTRTILHSNSSTIPITNHQSTSTSTSTIQYMPPSSTFSFPSQNTIPVLPSPLPTHPPKTKQ